jgi:4-hydroxybenzoate polyprenyltransferase
MTAIARLRTYGNLVAFSHTIFALPFAASALVLSRAEPHHVPLTLWRLLAMLVCMVTARTSAMAFNRWADRDVDAKNPRTKTRHIPAGLVPAKHALLLTIGSGLVFMASAATLGRWPALLSPLVLAVLLGYSLAKRFTWAAHVWLGVALALPQAACGSPPAPSPTWESSRSCSASLLGCWDSTFCIHSKTSRSIGKTVCTRSPPNSASAARS